MKNEGHTVYRSRIGWWVWAILAFIATVIIVTAIGSYWWLALIYGIGIGGVSLLGLFGTWYAIDGHELLVYQFCRPHRYPIAKIKSIKATTGILSAPALSTRRLAITFTDRSVLRSSMPLEISPVRRDEFVRQLLSVNPSITVSGDVNS